MRSADKENKMEGRREKKDTCESKDERERYSSQSVPREFQRFGVQRSVVSAHLLRGTTGSGSIQRQRVGY